MALAQGANVQEGKCLLALEELHGGDLPCGLVSCHDCISGFQCRPTLDDLAEDARGCHVGWWYDVL